ncbi:GDYXXLXY domain-containing protein [Nostoc sp. FACHB-110]|uniref:GDYXXLXY domain-containing protein n=1 Tax=Nostoc sp. FACHB-110 TaxID=2692834 RepID=UPI001688090D|nr:GDYXXLXY domain-containing protein [Nostoc sp. FACHB-110]MBD2436769.1 GDYXXLXY domain-containing protein [Nostoc sp. FACHB-110]
MKSDSPESTKNSEASKNKPLSPEAEFSGKLTFRDYLLATEQKANKPLPVSRLFIPLAIQAGIIFAIPFLSMYTNITGKEIILQTVPVNSRDVLQGNSLELDYNISRISTLRRLSGWEELLRTNGSRGGQLLEGTNLYVILQEQASFSRGVPRAWRPVRVTSNQPRSLSNNQAALKGVYQDGYVQYGLENYNVPDEQRRQINSDISQAVRQTRDGQARAIVVKAKVDSQGKAVPVSLWVRDRNYQF